MEVQSNALLQKNNMSRIEAEEIAESMDEEIHRLQYKLDHTRRLLQGAETNIGISAPPSWVTHDKKVIIAFLYFPDTPYEPGPNTKVTDPLNPISRTIRSLRCRAKWRF